MHQITPHPAADPILLREISDRTTDHQTIETDPFDHPISDDLIEKVVSMTIERAKQHIQLLSDSCEK